MKQKGLLILLIFAIIGLIDASYLTYEHYSGIIPPCSTNLLFLDCGKVLTSTYSVIGNIPLSLLGMIHYFVLFFLILMNILKKGKWYTLVVVQATIGFLVSLYLIYLQLFAIHSFCFYCMISAINSIILFIIALIFNKKSDPGLDNIAK
jgi:uncharacterized membrane protein